MARFAFLALLAPLFASSLVGAAPLSHRRSLARRAFTQSDYASFQISGGVGGNAAAEANAVFVEPFNGVDLTDITSAELKALSAMRSAAEAAETEKFNPAIEAASGAAADALKVGKIKNKVLKLTGISWIDKIKLAQATAKGKDAAEIAEIQTHLAEEQTKLAKNTATDVASAGKASTPVAGSASAPAAGTPAAEEPVTEETDVEEPAAEEPATEEPATEEPATEEPVVEEPATEEPAVEEPATEEPAVEEPVVEEPAAPVQSGSFKESAYADFQISSGTAGNAAAKAKAVFVDPFNGIELADISDADLKSLSTMRSAAESAETDKFNAAIKAASGDAAKALQVGKIQNKVLKLTGLAFIDKIKIAKAKVSGKSTTALEAHLAAEEKKLAKNTATDVASAGSVSTAA